jgi:hypothetical protein
MMYIFVCASGQRRRPPPMRSSQAPRLIMFRPFRAFPVIPQIKGITRLERSLRPHDAFNLRDGYDAKSPSICLTILSAQSCIPNVECSNLKVIIMMILALSYVGELYASLEGSEGKTMRMTVFETAFNLSVSGNRPNSRCSTVRIRSSWAYSLTLTSFVDL